MPDRYYILIIFSIAFLLRLPNLTESLWYDETWYTFVFLNPENIKAVLFNDVHPPLYPLLMRGWIEIFSDSELSIRIPPLIFGMISLGATFFLFRNCFNRNIALLATFIMALSPVHIWYSQEAKNNMLLLMLTVLAAWSLERAWTQKRLRFWILFLISAILSLYTNVFAIWIVSALFAWLLLQAFRNREQINLKAVCLSGIFVALAYLPFIVNELLQLGELNKQHLRPFTFSEIYNLFFIYLSHGNTLRTIFPWNLLEDLSSQHFKYYFIDGFYILLCLIGICFLGYHWLKRDGSLIHVSESVRSRIELVLIYLFLPVLLLWLISFFFPNIYIERSMIILLPPLLVLIVYGILAVPWGSLRYTLIGALIIINCLALYNLRVAKADTWTVWMPNPDWRSAAQFFEEETKGKSERFVIFHDAPQALVYHYQKLNPNKIDTQSNSRSSARLPLHQIKHYNRDKIYTFLDQKGVKTFFLIHNRFMPGSFYQLLRAIAFDKRYIIMKKASFKGIDIYQCFLFPRVS